MPFTSLLLVLGRGRDRDDRLIHRLLAFVVLVALERETRWARSKAGALEMLN
jgi:hypothetical protein